MAEELSRESLAEAAAQADRALPITALEVYRAIQGENPLLLRLLGYLMRVNNEAGVFMVGADLITEEGWRRAILKQGQLAGRVQQVESLFDLILEGQSYEDDAAAKS